MVSTAPAYLADLADLLDDERLLIFLGVVYCAACAEPVAKVAAVAQAHRLITRHLELEDTLAGRRRR